MSTETKSPCEGHPAGPEDVMGETTYCDGSCNTPPKSVAKPKLTTELLVELVTELYLQKGVFLTVAEIAAATHYSESTVRKALGPYGVPEPLTAHEEMRTSFSSNYRGMSTGAHKVWTYGPKLTTLRKLILAARKES